MTADDEPFANKIAKRVVVGFASLCILPYIYLLLLAAATCIGRGDQCGGGDRIQSLGIIIYVLFVPECIAALIVFYALARSMTNLGLSTRCIWFYGITLNSCMPYMVYLLHKEGGLFLFLISLIPVAGAAFIVFSISSSIATWKLVKQAEGLRCLIPGFDGALFTREWKEALWAKFTMAAPQRRRQSVERYSIVKRA